MIHESGQPGNFTSTGTGDHQQSWWWVFALVLIFLALIFLWGRRDEHPKHNNYLDGMLPALAMSNMMGHQKPACGVYDHQHWDMALNDAREFGNIKMEIKETAWQQSRDQDKYFYEQQKTNLVGFKDVEIQNLNNTARIESRIDQLEKTFKEDEIRRQGNRINYLETVLALQPRPIQPSYPVNPPVAYPPGPNHFTGWATADSCNYGFAGA